MKPRVAIVCLALCVLAASPGRANIPGGGTGTGPDVTLVDNGDGTVTMDNGIIAIVITKGNATIHEIYYTYNNSGTTVTNQVLSGGVNGGQLYWELGGFGGGTFVYSVMVDPASNGGDYAEVGLLSSSAGSGTMEVRFSMLRGSTGFYVTAIWNHRSMDGAMSMGETRDNIYAGSIFNWMSVDGTRNRLMEVQPGSRAIGVFGAPVEVSLWTNGIYAGQYEDKYKYSADFGEQRVWGWSSVGAGGWNIGLWNVSASVEYYGGGPMKRELMEHIGTTILNMTRGSHYGGGTDSSWASGEVWTHVYGPYLIYCNNITNSITDTNQAAQALYADALAQAAAEQSAWPYSWFTNLPAYATASDRGTVTGQLVIDDAYNPNASASNIWVGLVQQPSTTANVYDFQKWFKPYQFWVRTGANGTFTVPNVIAGTNYTLYAFGPGAAGTFQSQPQSGGSAPNSVDIPSSPFSVTVTGGTTDDLGAVTWTPTNMGPTVFEIGIPDRNSTEFRHGEDWWVGDIGPDPADPSPIWSKWLEYPFDFPTGPDYVVGQSRWTTDWNFVQPVVPDSYGVYQTSSSTITFNLASAPGSKASLYLALSSDDNGPIVVRVNGTTVANYTPAYHTSVDQSDSTVREGIHGMFTDNRINFAGNLLQQGQNTITILMNQGGYFANHAMYDYLRLELTGYIPPPPSSVSGYGGNTCGLIAWPVTPGATGYNVLRSTNQTTGYVSVATGVPGPVCGSGPTHATYLDTNLANGTVYYYEIQSVNPVGTSPNSPSSGRVQPLPGISTNPPAAPTGLLISGITHKTLNWMPPTGADFYTVYRSTLVDNGGGASNVLRTIVLDNQVHGTSYTDTSSTDGTIYEYYLTATSAGGTSSNSAPATAVPLPLPLATAPGSLTGYFDQPTSIVLSWSSVPGAVGYIIRRATDPGGPYTFVMSVTETIYTDSGLIAAPAYYYQVAAVNAAGVSTNATVAVTTPPSAPASLSAIPGDAQVILNWSPAVNATGYVLSRGTGSSSENVVVVSDYAGTSYTNTGLANGTTYYYVVAGTNDFGLGPASPEASATPDVNLVFTPRSLTWKGDGSANIWDVSGAANWQTNGGGTTFHNGDTVTFDNSGSNNVPVSLAGTLQPAQVIVDASKSYTFSGSGSIAGTNALIKAGVGSLTINTTNAYSGGTILSNNGNIFIGSAAANLAGLGTGAVSFYGGSLDFNGYTGSTTPDYGGNTNPLIVPTGQTGTIYVPQRFLTPGFAGSLSGGGTLYLQVKFVRGDISGDWSAFAGTINVIHSSSGSTVDDFRVANSNGFPNAILNLGPYLSMYSRAPSGSVIPVGEFSAASSVVVAANGTGGLGGKNAVTWRVGGRNTDATNAASFQGILGLIKEGTGSWTLTGNSTHTGPTTVNDGVLMLNGNFNGSPVIVSGGWLSGTGSISGAGVTIDSGGGFAPGNPLGTLTISNDLMLAAGSASSFVVEHSPLTNNAAQISGTLTEGGTLEVANVGGTLADGDTFKLFSAGTFAGEFDAFDLPLLSGNLVWNTHTLKVSGTLSVVTLSPPVITSLELTGGNLVIGGSGGVDHWPFLILSSTNLALPPAQWTRVGTNEFNAAGLFSVTNSINPDQAQSYYLLELQ